MQTGVAWIAAVALACGAVRAPKAGAAPVKARDLVSIEGADPVELLGYGLVLGLNCTGDGRTISYTRQSIRNLLERMGLTVPDDMIRPKNVASVMVTATLTPWDRTGSLVDATVSSIGDATSLAGGTLLLTELRGPDGRLYATAQGAVSLGGFDVTALSGSRVRRNVVTAGRVPEGARVVDTIEFAPPAEGPLHLHLDTPDFTVAGRLAEGLNRFWGGNGTATAIDAGRVALTLNGVAQPGGLAQAMAALEQVEVEPSQAAKVVINERTGTLVAGGDVRLQPATVAHGNLNVRIEQGFFVSQPTPYSYGGETVVVPESSADASADPGEVVSLPPTATADELARALNALGVTPRDLIAIFQALKQAGALPAKLEIL
jgi:flagellar P-ring protein precursor FlgI